MNLVGTLGKMLLSNALSKGSGGNLLGSLLGGQSGGAGQGGALGSLLGSLAGGGGAASGTGGNLGGLLGQLMGGSGGGAGAGSGGLGSLLGAALGQQQPVAPAAPVAAPEQTDQAAILIRAMVNAAKSDGQVDQQEQEKIVGRLGDIGTEEAQFIRAEMAKPLDVNAFVSSVPAGMGQQVYLMSLLSINLDNKAEAQYLDQLANGLGISHEISNQLHTEVGAPTLYS
ncbi:MAG: DUF533 domain-containing protein [Granulosicoccus sp.]